MKRLHNPTIDNRKREELRKAKCIDVDSIPDPSVLSTVLENYQQVIVYDPTFGANPQNVSELYNYIDEHNKLTQTLKSSGLTDTEEKPNAILKQMQTKYSDAILLGFNLLTWKAAELNTFNDTWNQLYNQLLALGYGGEKTTMNGLKVLTQRVETIQSSGIQLPQKWSDTELELIEKQAPDLSNNKVVQAFPEFNKLHIEQFVDNSFNNMTAGTKLVVSIPFTAEAFFSETIKNISFIKFTTFTVAQRLFHHYKMRFFLKLESEAEIIDVETGEITVSKFKFPQTSTWSVRLQSSLNTLDKALDDVIENISNRPLSNTRQRLHKFKQLTVKVANRQFGGCSKYVNIDLNTRDVSFIQEGLTICVFGDVWQWHYMITFQELPKQTVRHKEKKLLKLETNTIHFVKQRQ